MVANGDHLSSVDGLEDTLALVVVRMVMEHVAFQAYCARCEKRGFYGGKERECGREKACDDACDDSDGVGEWMRW
jgi:hypothetical protein